MIDGRILSWTISTLGDDDSLQEFLEAMPGFFDSEKVKDIREHLPYDLLRNALAGFLGRTLSSKSVIQSVKLHRLEIFMDTIKLLGEDSIRAALILETFLLKQWNLAPQTIEAAQALARWTSNDQRTALYIRCTVARVLATVPERDGRWVELAARISGLPERDLRDISQTGDNLLLATLIDLCRQADHSDESNLVDGFPRFDIRGTHPRLQHDFCALWNEFVDKARIGGNSLSTPVLILCSIRHYYLALHQGNFEISDISNLGFCLLQSLSYPQCSIASHRRQESIADVRVINSLALPPVDESPHFLVRRSTFEGITVSRQVKKERIITRPRSLSEPVIAESSQNAPSATSPTLQAHTSPYFTHASLPLPDVVALQDTPTVNAMSYLSEGATRRNVAPCAEPDIDEDLSTASTAAPTITLAPVPASIPPFLSHSLASCDAVAASAPSPFPSALSVVGFSIPAFPPPSHVLPSNVPPSRIPLSRVVSLPNSESLGLISSTTPSHLTVIPTLPRLRSRGLMNTENVCFMNVVLQILVHSPLLWNLFRELGDLKRQRRTGVPETGSGTTPLVDATVRLFEEFMLKEEPPQNIVGKKTREDEVAKKKHDVIDSFEPMYIYEAMKEKRQLKNLLVRPNDRDASFCY